MAKQQEANIKTRTPNRDPDMAEPELVEEIVKSIA
jgi:hypothetical protein